MQLASVTGLWGISFLITWFGSTVNWAWEHQFNWMVIQRGMLVYALTYGIVMLAGGVRLAFTQSKKTVRVAAIGWPEDILKSDTFTHLI